MTLQPPLEGLGEGEALKAKAIGTRGSDVYHAGEGEGLGIAVRQNQMAGGPIPSGQPREEEEVLSWQKPGRCGVEEAGLLAHSDESHSGQKTYPCPCLFYQCLKALRDLDACIRLVETLSCHSLPWKLGSHVGTNARAWGCSPPPLLKETLKMQTR